MEVVTYSAEVVWDALQGEDISMLILLPNEMDGIYQLDKKINTVNLDDFTWTLDSENDVEVQLPRFNMMEQINLKDTLTKVGSFHILYSQHLKKNSMY